MPSKVVDPTLAFDEGKSCADRERRRANRTTTQGKLLVVYPFTMKKVIAEITCKMITGNVIQKTLAKFARLLTSACEATQAAPPGSSMPPNLPGS